MGGSSTALAPSFPLAAADKLHPQRHDFDALAPAAVVSGLVLARAQPPFDVRLPALLQVFLADFRELGESDHVVPFDVLAPLAVLVT